MEIRGAAEEVCNVFVRAHRRTGGVRAARSQSDKAKSRERGPFVSDAVAPDGATDEPPASA